MNVLITGITGFAGSHLVDYISENHSEVQIWGTRRYRSRMDNYEGPRMNVVNWVDDVDLTDPVAVRRAVELSLPDRVFHLSAKSFVPESYINPSAVLCNNIVGQQNLFEALRQTFGQHHNVRVQIACSSEEYGFVRPEETPISEKNPLRPLSPYGVSKVAQDSSGFQEWKTYGTHVVRTRGFNHTGSRRGDAFVCSNFAKQIAEIEAGIKGPTVKVGNLKAVRDFTDVRDMVKAYWLALEAGEPGEVYNIGTGRGWTMEQVLFHFVEQCAVDITIEEDPSRMRLSDVPILECDSTKFRDQTGWFPEREFPETLNDILRYWRART
jgi:GDP-4-dehydro-6-deoxy-D-mannose reductase